MADEDSDDWQILWDARLSALERVLGASDDVVGHATIPFDLGADIGGAADIVYFRHHIDGVVAVTAELIGCEDQVKNRLGNYELMICQRDDAEWGANMISSLAYYTLEAELNPGETMAIGSAAPGDSTIAALLFYEYARFVVREEPAGLLLCVGITQDELAACRRGRRAMVEKALERRHVFPFTDLARASTLREPD
jgi:hypothetical protein